jgi:hypothetical protein
LRIKTVNAKEGAMNRYWMLLLTALLPACDMATRVASIESQPSTAGVEATAPSADPIKIDPALRDALMRAEAPKVPTAIASQPATTATAKRTAAPEPLPPVETSSAAIDPVQRLLAGIPTDPKSLPAAAQTPREIMGVIARGLIEDPMSRPDPDLLADLGTRDREWIELLARFLRELDPNDPETSARAARVLADRLDEQSALRIPTMVACGSVADFGRYEPLLPADPVKLYRPNPTFVLYAELDRFQYTQKESGYHYDFEARIEVFDTKGQLLHEEDWFTFDDISRRPIRDFFVAVPCQLPAGLEARELTMKLRLRQGGAEAQRVLPLRLTDDYDVISRPSELNVRTANVPS